MTHTDRPCCQQFFLLQTFQKKKGWQDQTPYLNLFDFSKRVVLYLKCRCTSFWEPLATVKDYLEVEGSPFLNCGHSRGKDFTDLFGGKKKAYYSQFKQLKHKFKFFFGSWDQPTFKQRKGLLATDAVLPPL